MKICFHFIYNISSVVGKLIIAREESHERFWMEIGEKAMMILFFSSCICSFFLCFCCFCYIIYVLVINSVPFLSSKNERFKLFLFLH